MPLDCKLIDNVTGLRGAFFDKKTFYLACFRVYKQWFCPLERTKTPIRTDLHRKVRLVVCDSTLEHFYAPLDQQLLLRTVEFIENGTKGDAFDFVTHVSGLSCLGRVMPHGKYTR